MSLFMFVQVSQNLRIILSDTSNVLPYLAWNKKRHPVNKHGGNKNDHSLCSHVEMFH